MNNFFAYEFDLREFSLFLLVGFGIKGGIEMGVLVGEELNAIGSCVGLTK